MDMQGPDFSNCKDQMFPDFRDPMKIFSESRDPIFNSRDANRVPKTLKNWSRPILLGMTGLVELTSDQPLC